MSASRWLDRSTNTNQLEFRKAQSRLERVGEQQFTSLQIIIEREGCEPERDDGVWPVRFSRGPTIAARSFNS